MSVFPTETSFPSLRTEVPARFPPSRTAFSFHEGGGEGGESVRMAYELASWLISPLTRINYYNSSADRTARVTKKCTKGRRDDGRLNARYFLSEDDDRFRRVNVEQKFPVNLEDFQADTR